MAAFELYWLSGMEMATSRSALPTLEHRVLDPSGHLVAQVDLAYPDELIAIELQSKRWHRDVSDRA